MSDKRIIRAAAVQITPDFDSHDGTAKKVCNVIDEAGSKGVQIIVFPETFLPYYPREECRDTWPNHKSHIRASTGKQYGCCIRSQ